MYCRAPALDAGPRRAATGLLGGLFSTPLYHPALAGTPPEEGNWNYLGRLFQTPLYHPALAGAPPEEGNWHYLGGLFQTRLYPLHPCRRASMRACP